jgi:cobalt-zinc-cadmium efflux system outer membrane protein
VVSVTLPLLNHNQGAIAEAQARRTETVARFNVLQAGVLGEIDLAMAGYRAALQKKKDADAMLVNLQHQEKSARAMFAAGEISKSELAGLQLQFGAATLARQDAVTKVCQAAGQLEDALQSPLGLPDSVWQNSARTTGHKESRSRP